MVYPIKGLFTNPDKAETGEKSMERENAIGISFTRIMS
jgi:hypothetical protein